MEIKKNEKPTIGIKLSVEEDGQELGRAWLYLIYNDLHDRPYGLLEDVFVEEKSRGRGVGNELLQAIITEAQTRNCYKLIGTSRDSRKEVHEWYKRKGFKQHGIEFRMDF